MTNRDWKILSSEVIQFQYAIDKIDDEAVIALIFDHLGEVFELWKERIYKPELEKGGPMHSFKKGGPMHGFKIKDFASYVEYATRVGYGVDEESAGLLLQDEGIKHSIESMARRGQKQVKEDVLLYFMTGFIEIEGLGKNETFRRMAKSFTQLGYAGEAAAKATWYDALQNKPELIESYREFITYIVNEPTNWVVGKGAISNHQ